ncbi:MAG: response regulator [Treponema sp.]|nr:response regulator [Treponema sp.]
MSKSNPPKILIVDDEPVNLRILGSMLQQKGLDVGFASSAAQALESLEYRIPDLFLLDVMMPNVDGYELALKLRSLPATENIPIIFISALDDTDSKIKGFDSGGADYISKPFNPREVAARVFSQLELKEYRDNLEEKVKEQVLEIETITMTLVEVLENANYYRDDETGLHIRRVKEFSKQLAFYLDIPEQKKREIARYSSLHDIGKIGVPDSILRKPDKLTPEEFKIIQQHPVIGHRILDKETIPETAKNIVLYHHEKWDGSGYPHQLKNNEIPIEAQIVAMADVYDALRSRRIYKPPYSAEHAEKIIIENAETHFNPDLVRIFIRVKGEFATIMETYKEAIE